MKLLLATLLPTLAQSVLDTLLPTAAKSACDIPEGWPHHSTEKDLGDYFDCLRDKCENANRVIFDVHNDITCDIAYWAGVPCDSVVPGLPHKMADICPKDCAKKCLSGGGKKAEADDADANNTKAPADAGTPAPAAATTTVGAPPEVVRAERVLEKEGWKVKNPPPAAVVVDHSWPVEVASTCSGKEEQFALCADNPLCGTCEPQDCEVSDWNEWSSGDCTGLCERERRITAHNNECGMPCNKSLVETKGGGSCLTCSAPNKTDCEWGVWEDWSACTCPCGGGQQTRDRRIKKSPVNGGKMCDANNRTEITPCNIQSCGADCRDGEWASWSDWGGCSHSCGGGTRWRSREVKTEANECGEPAIGFSQEYEQCNEAVSCVTDKDCEFGDWSAWSDCSCTCDGVKRRSRSIAAYGAGMGKWCFGATKEIDQCNPDAGAPPPAGCGGEPAQNCEMTDWKDWSECTAPCGGGQMVRMRRVDSEAKFGGKPCNNTLAETIPCHVEPCRLGKKVVDCKWSDWGKWGACDKCGGEKRRYRHIDKMPEHGGKACVYQASEEFTNCTRHCHDQTYCTWGDWTAFGDCTTTCGAGYKKRSRNLKVLPVTPPPPPPSTKLYEELEAKATQIQNNRAQEMITSFAVGGVSFIMLLSAGRAMRSRNDYRSVGLE